MAFVRYLNYGASKDGYSTYCHMGIQIEDYIVCLQYLYPQFEYMFELDNSNGHTVDCLVGLSTTPSVINMGWGGKQRKIRDTVLTENNIGPITHTQSLIVVNIQSIVFLTTDLPPIFDPDIPKYDISKEGESVTHKYNKTDKEIGSAGYQ